MRFIAIFNQYQITHTLGFNSVIEALDFLFWGYEDQHLLPYGIYDKETDQVTAYTHVGQPIHSIREELISAMAKKHLALSHFPAATTLYLNESINIVQ